MTTAASSPSAPLEALVCSARGCRAAPSWALRWNNPSLHDPDRRKTWLACEEHLDSLRSFLASRGFLRSVDPAPPAPGSGAPTSGTRSP